MPILWSSSQPVAAEESIAYAFSLDTLFSNAYGETMTYLVTGFPFGSGLRYDANTKSLLGTPNAVDRRASPLPLSVTAKRVTSLAGEVFPLSLSVDADPYPAPTLLSALPDVTGTQGKSVIEYWTSYFESPSGVVFEVTGLPLETGLYVSADGILQVLLLFCKAVVFFAIS
jgi:hypothetical protein